MSIGACTNCTFTDTVFSNTSGTWPMCGVDVSAMAPFASFSDVSTELLRHRSNPAAATPPAFAI